MQRFGHHRPQQEREMRGYQWLQAGIGPFARTAVITSLIIGQQYPALGKGTFSNGVQGPNVRNVAIKENAITTQEAPRLGTGINFCAGVQGPDVRPPIRDTIIVPQEAPRLGTGTLGFGRQGPNVRPPITDTAIITQEPSRSGYAITQAGIQGPDVQVPVTSSAITTQERPREGYSFVQFGKQGPDVASGIGSIFTQQERPFHPGPVFWNFIVTIPGQEVLGRIRVFVSQQYPDLGRTFFQTGVQGPDVRPPIRDTIVSKQQELPRTGVGTFSTGVQGPNVEPQRITWAFVAQRYPADIGRAFTWFGVQGPNVAREVGRVFVRQEQPSHPVGIKWQFIPPLITDVPPVSRGVFTRQELPRLGGGIARVGVPGATVAPPTRRSIFVAQEHRWQYYHPRGFTLSHVRFVPRPADALAGVTVFTRQELPRHPGFFTRGVDRPNNVWPPYPTKFPPLQENLTKDMLGKTTQRVFYADPGFDRQIITSINYPQGQYYVTGWTPIGGVKYPIGNMYNRDLVQPPRPVAKWFHEPDLVGGWITEHMNLTKDYVTLDSQKSFFVEPLELHVNNLMPQLYPTGLTPIGINTTRRGMLGVKPYG